jgi:glycosyltransferase involved in cell wall biosynthesis
MLFPTDMSVMTDDQRMTTISVVIPVYNGSDYLPELLAQIHQVRQQMSRSGLLVQLSECICVEDDPVDDSAATLQTLQQDYYWLRVLTLSTNFGQHAATVAGILHSSGDWVVTLDEDLQHDPHHIASLLKDACLNSRDVIYARPAGSIHHSWYRDAASKWTKRCAARFAGNPFIPQFNSFRLIRGSLARAAASRCAPETYFDIALTWFTKRIGSVTFSMKDRRTADGKPSGYRFRSLTRHATRLIVTSDSRLLRFGARLGFFGMLVAVILASLIVVGKYFYPELIPVQGWASTIIILLAVNSVVAIQCGLAMKYLSLILQRSQGRPTFFVVDRSTDRDLLKSLETFLAFEKTLTDAPAAKAEI